MRIARRLRGLLLVLGWTTVVLLAYAALGQSFGSYSVSRWAGVGVGLILAITAARQPPEVLWGPFWWCLVIAVLLACGPQQLHALGCADDGDGCDPLPYSQIIRLWTVLDTVAVVVYGWALERLRAAWHLADQAERKRAIEAWLDAQRLEPPDSTPPTPPSGGSAYDTETGESIPRA